MIQLVFKIPSNGYLHKIPITLEEKGQHLNIYSEYNAVLLDELRCFQAAKPVYSDEKKFSHWQIANSERNQYAIKFYTGFIDTNYYSEIPPLPDDYTIPWHLPLRPYQIEGVEFALHRRRCVLAYQMRLGKTITALTVLHYAVTKENKHNWWLVAPTGAQKEWERQIREWNVQYKPLIFSTYESLYKCLDAIPEEKSDTLLPDGVIFDESIKIKTPTAKRSQIANALCTLIRQRKSNPFILLLSGSPTCWPPDWWHQVEVCQPGFIREGSIHRFRDRYAIIEKQQGAFGMFPKIVGWKEDEVKKLGKRLAPIVLVKQRKDVLDFPEKIYETHNTPIDEETRKLALIFTECIEDKLELLKKMRELSDGFQYEDKLNQTSTAEKLRFTATGHKVSIDNPERMAGRPYSLVNRNKLKYLEALLDQHSREDGGTGRLIIFAAYHASIDLINETVLAKNWIPFIIDGRGWSHEDALERFQTNLDEGQYAIVAHPAVVHGLTLSAAETIIYYSNSFSPDHRVQSEDRAELPGLKKGTRIIDLIHLPTDEKVMKGVTGAMNLQDITLEEIKRCLQ